MVTSRLTRNLVRLSVVQDAQTPFHRSLLERFLRISLRIAILIRSWPGPTFLAVVLLLRDHGRGSIDGTNAIRV